MPILPVILQPAKEATPAFALSGLVVQLSVPPGLVPRPRVTGLVALVTTLPPGSSMLTEGCVAHTAPSTPPPGCAVNANLVGLPIAMVRALLLVLVSPVAEAVRV